LKRSVKISVPFQADKQQELRHIRNITPLPPVEGIYFDGQIYDFCGRTDEEGTAEELIRRL
jgi:hypothetical protein